MTASRSGTARRELVLALALCAAGAGLILLAAGQAWVGVRVSRPNPLPPVGLTASASAVEPLVSALGVVGLAGVVGLLATRRTGRMALGVLLAAAGAVVLVRALPHLAAPSRQHALDLVTARGRTVGLGRHPGVSAEVHPLWPLLAALGGLALAAGGALAVWRGRRWPGMSGRYEVPAGRGAPVDGVAAVSTAAPAGVPASAPSHVDLWDAMDDGRDLTES